MVFSAFIFSVNILCKDKNIYGVGLETEEKKAVANIMTLFSTESAYRMKNSKYVTLDELASDDSWYIDTSFAGGQKDGYIFNINVDNRRDIFFIIAEPVDTAENHTFYIDERGILCKSYDVNTQAPIRHATSVCPAHFRETNLQTEFGS